MPRLTAARSQTLLVFGMIVVLASTGCLDGSCDCDGEPPTIRITSPADGENVSGTVTITAEVSDDEGVDRVLFYIDQQLPADGTDIDAPYEYSWDTRAFPKGETSAHTLRAKAYDTSGNAGTSDVVNVTVGVQCPYDVTDFTGILETDEVGEILGGDSSDWCPSGGVVPSAHGLGPAYPNSATGAITIPFALPLATDVVVEIIDRNCVVIRTLVDASLLTGHYTVLWDLADQSGSPVPADLYRCVMVAAGFYCHGDIQVE
ncbi:MAG: hypothetical protein KAW17_08320 [Candidatus Eisenbacteria sp.]|nr:hypothetical protein [Candidatus Eisenbacteria bacterium]